MKSLISVSLIFGVLVAFGSDLIVPRTCTEQIENEPLNVGALAYRLAAEGDVADLTIGGERGTKVQVIDRTGIHGYREKEVANDDFVVTHSEGVIFDVMTDTYRVDTTSSAQFGVTNWVKCTIPIGRIICSVGREIVNKRSDVTFGGAPVGDVVERIEGNEWTMVLIWNKVVSDAPAQGTLSVARIKPKFLAVGSKNWVNDLIRTEFPMRDTLGELGLGKWREWARDYIDRADYTHWANAPATNNVAMNGKSIIFDPNGRYEIFASPSSNLVIQAGGVQGLEFDFHGVPLSGALRFTGFDYLNGVASIEYFQDIDGFDPTQLVIQEADSIVRPISWQTVVPTRVVSLTDHSYQIIGISGPQKFYRMVYNGEQTAVLTIVIRGQLNVTGDIGFNGTTLTQELGDLRAEIAAHAPGNYETVSNRAMTALQEHQSLEPATNYTDAVTLAAITALDTALRAEIAAHAPANYAAVSNAAIYASNTVANIHIDAEDQTFKAAVLAVGLSWDAASVTNAVAALNDFKEAFGDLGTGDIVGGAGTIGTIILALIGAVTWLKKNKITTPTGGAVGNVLKKTADGVEWGEGGGGGVTKIVAGDNVTISPAGGTGEVTISASGGGGGGSGHKVIIANTMNDTTAENCGASIVRMYKVDGTYQDVTLNAASRGQEFEGIVWIDVIGSTNALSCFNIVSYRLGSSGNAPYGTISSGNTYKEGTDGTSSYGKIIANGEIVEMGFPFPGVYCGLYMLSTYGSDTPYNFGSFFKTFLLPCDTYLICQGGPSYCLLKGTQVALDGHRTKAIEDITYEDDILVWDFDNGCLTTAKPVWIKRGEVGTHYWRNEFASGRVVLTTGEGYGHRFFDAERGAFVPNTECQVSYNIDGKEDRLVKCERIDAPCEYYNVITAKHFNLFANGILASTSLNNLYPIRGMRFDKSGADAAREWTGRGFGRGLVDGLRLAEQPRDVAETESYVQRLVERMV